MVQTLIILDYRLHNPAVESYRKGGRRPGPVPVRTGGAHLPLQDATELFPENEIDEEVRGGVEHFEQAAQLRQKELSRRTRLPGRHRTDHLKDPGRRVAQDEHDYHDDHDQRHVLLVLLSVGIPSGTQHRIAFPVDSPVVGDQTEVEGRQKDQRQKEAEHVVADVNVHELIASAPAKLRYGVVLVATSQLLLDAKLEETRDVVDEAEYQDAGDAMARRPKGTEGGGVVGQRDGDEATGRDQYRRPDGRHLTDEDQRVRVQAQVVVRDVVRSQVAEVFEREEQRPGAGPRRQEEYVDGGQRAQQQRRDGRSVAVAAENGYGEAVRHDSRGAQQPGDDAVDVEVAGENAFSAIVVVVFRGGIVVGGAARVGADEEDRRVRKGCSRERRVTSVVVAVEGIEAHREGR